MIDTKTKLLEKAAELVQIKGYNGFSFHDLADTVGVRTASIHYHFPTKLALGEALIKLYAEGFFEALGSPEQASPQDRLRHYVSLFRRSLQRGRMCLCGMIGAEVSSLPPELGQGVHDFFKSNEAWLTEVYQRAGLPRTEANGRALLMLAALEGAMMIARTSGKTDSFERVAKTVLAV